MHKVTKTEHHTILEVRPGDDFPWVVIRYRNDMQGDPLAWTFTEERAAHEWMQFQEGWLHFWSPTGHVLPDDASEAFRSGWDAAGADANERAMWLEHQRSVERDDEEQQRHGWMT